jgi:hypothetical protein
MKLKRCPFCNSHDLGLEITQNSHAIKCFECFAIGPVSVKGIERACAYWNDGQIGSTAMVNMQRKYTNRNDIKEVEL